MENQRLAIDAEKLAQKLEAIEEMLRVLGQEIADNCGSAWYLEKLGQLRAELDFHGVDSIITQSPGR